MKIINYPFNLHKCIILSGDIIKTILLKHQGFCSGVLQALNTTLATLKNSDKPIYLYGSLVNNDFVNSELMKKGITIIERDSNLKDFFVNLPLGIIIFGAHGISQIEIDTAKALGLEVIDTTCVYVRQAAKNIQKYLAQDYQIIYLGKKNHPEAIAIKSLDPQKIIIIENADDLGKINIGEEIFFTCQTTMREDEWLEVKNEVARLHPNAQISDFRCRATIEHQKEIENIQGVDAIVVVSDKKSNNGQKLLSLAQKKVGASHAVMISSSQELEKSFINSHQKIAIASSASTPLAIIQMVENYINGKETTLNDLDLFNY